MSGETCADLGSLQTWTGVLYRDEGGAPVDTVIAGKNLNRPRPKAQPRNMN